MIILYGERYDLLVSTASRKRIYFVAAEVVSRMRQLFDTVACPAAVQCN